MLPACLAWGLKNGSGAGGGAVEAALSIYLENFATTLGSREQLAIAEVADALLVIPKALAVNAAKDATELVRPSGLVWHACLSAWRSILMGDLRLLPVSTQRLPQCRSNAILLCLQVAKLRAYHYTAQTKPEKAGLARYGLDLIKGALRNNVEAGVLEPVLAKLKIIQVSG